MKQSAMIGLATALFSCGAAVAVPVPRPVLADRLESDVDIIGIVHWGFNTYMDHDWGYGDEDPAMLNPKSFDADQIVRGCADGGIKGLVFVAKHHDGFCLWPTKTTDFNISKAPFRNGKGDYMREMSDACRRANVLFGVYVSPWDRNNAGYATPAYVKTFHEQVRELLDGRYGEVFEMWFDGANGGDGYYGGAREVRKIGPNYYDFDTLFVVVRKLQSKACIFTERRDDADFRWPANERGILADDSRATIRPYDCEENFPTYGNVGDIGGTVFHPCEADFPLRPSWFYQESQNGSVKSGEYLMKLYLSCVGNGGMMNIGIAPDRDGRLHAEDVRELRRFREIKERFFSVPVRDGGLFNMIVMSEDIRKGERIVHWDLFAGKDALLSGKSIGRRRIRLLDKPLLAKDCMVKAFDADGGVISVRTEFFRVDPKLAQSVSDATDPSIVYDRDGVAQFISSDERTAVCRFKASSTFNCLVFVPDLKRLGGTPVAFRLSVSDDGKVWKQVKGGVYRLDNVAANPIPQYVRLSESVRGTYLRVEAERTLSDKPFALFGVNSAYFDK